MYNEHIMYVWRKIMLPPLLSVWPVGPPKLISNIQATTSNVSDMGKANLSTVSSFQTRKSMGWFFLRGLVCWKCVFFVWTCVLVQRVCVYVNIYIYTGHPHPGYHFSQWRWRHIATTHSGRHTHALMTHCDDPFPDHTLPPGDAFPPDDTLWRHIPWRHITPWRRIPTWRHIVTTHSLRTHYPLTTHYPVTTHCDHALPEDTLPPDDALPCDDALWPRIAWRRITPWRRSTLQWRHIPWRPLLLDDTWQRRVPLHVAWPSG